MWAMIPMLRTLPRSVSTSRATRFLFLLGDHRDGLVGLAAGCGAGPATVLVAGAVSPAVVRERLVRLRHLVRVLATLDGRAEAVRGVEQLVAEAVDHRLLAARPRVGDQPAQPERGRAAGAHLDRHLVGRATDTAAADLAGGGAGRPLAGRRWGAPPPRRGGWRPGGAVWVWWGPGLSVTTGSAPLRS